MSLHLTPTLLTRVFLVSVLVLCHTPGQLDLWKILRFPPPISAWWWDYRCALLYLAFNYVSLVYDFLQLPVFSLILKSSFQATYKWHCTSYILLSLAYFALTDPDSLYAYMISSE